jgi:hypothetical protein
VSGGGRYRREHDEELTVTYRLSPTEEAKAALDGFAWRCALQREKRVSGDRCGDMWRPGGQCHLTSGPGDGLSTTDKWATLNSFSKSNLNVET